MNESKTIRDPVLGEATFRRIEESKKPNVVTYVLELRDGRYAQTQKLRRYNLNGRKIITTTDELNKQQEIDEMNSAYQQLLTVLRTQEQSNPVRGTLRPVLTHKIGNIHEFREGS
jgi:hypothetical protein